MIWVLSLLQSRMVKGGILGQFHCWFGCVQMNLRRCMRCVVDSVHHREKTVASSGSCCLRLNITARLDTFWKVAFRSNATKTRDWSASAKYCVDLIFLLAPSLHPTPCWSAPAASVTDVRLAAITALSASRRIMRSGLCPPVGQRYERAMAAHERAWMTGWRGV